MIKKDLNSVLVVGVFEYKCPFCGVREKLNLFDNDLPLVGDFLVCRVCKEELRIVYAKIKYEVKK